MINPNQWIKGEPIPDAKYQQEYIQIIMNSEPKISLFNNYYWLTGRPVPRRLERETSEQYLKKHWKKLKKAAQDWKIIDLPAQP